MSKRSIPRSNFFQQPPSSEGGSLFKVAVAIGALSVPFFPGDVDATQHWGQATVPTGCGDDDYPLAKTSSCSLPEAEVVADASDVDIPSGLPSILYTHSSEPGPTIPGGCKFVKNVFSPNGGWYSCSLPAGEVIEDDIPLAKAEAGGYTRDGICKDLTPTIGYFGSRVPVTTLTPIPSVQISLDQISNPGTGCHAPVTAKIRISSTGKSPVVSTLVEQLGFHFSVQYTQCDHDGLNCGGPVSSQSPFEYRLNFGFRTPLGYKPTPKPHLKPTPKPKPKPTPSARRPLIFVVGMMGSELTALRFGGRVDRDSHGEPRRIDYKVWQTVWVDERGPQKGGWMTAGNQENLDILRFKNGSPVDYDFVDDGYPVLTKNAGYPDVEKFFVSQGYTPKKDFFFYTYDWRYDAARSAILLRKLIEQDLKGKQVDIIAHSMGALVAREALLSGHTADQVHKAVFLSGVNLGTPRGAFAAMYGFPIVPFQQLPFPSIAGLPAHILKYLSDTFPGELDLAPSESYYKVFRGQDSQHPIPFIDLRTSAGNNYKTLRNAEKELNVAETAITPGEALHQDDLSWPVKLANKVALFSGVGQCTLGQIQISRDARSGLPPYDFSEINGDGTVTVGSSSMDDGKAGGATLPVYYRQYNHNDMGDNPNVLKDALQVIQGKVVDHAAPHPPTCQTIAVQGNSEVLLTDQSGHRVGGLNSSQNFNESPGSSFWRIGDLKVATVDMKTPFTVRLAGTKNGEATVQVRTWGGAGIQKETAFPHIPTTGKTTGSFMLNAQSIGVLRLQINGASDKTHMKTLQALPVQRRKAL